MEKAQIMTGWVGDGLSTETSYRPALADAHNITGFEDKTGITGSSAYVIEVTAETAIMDAIDADPNYVILWREEIEEPV